MAKQTERKEEIVICKHCGKPEYWGAMRWLSGWCACRNCYRSIWEEQNKKRYTWDDLDGPRPTLEEYKEQEAKKCENTN